MPPLKQVRQWPCCALKQRRPPPPKDRDLLPLTGRLLTRLVLTDADDDACFVLAWLRWRRRHQQRIKLCHYRARGHDPTQTRRNYKVQL